MIQIFRGRVEGGKLRLDREDEYAALVASLEGKPIEQTLRKERKRRGNSQNRFYWGVVLKTVADQLGWDVDDLHHELKRKFLAVEHDTALVMTRSTADLDTAEFTEYIDNVMRLAAEMGIYVPSPGEVDF
jgi:hypothetical protein